MVFIGGFALLEWSPDARPGSDAPTPLLVDIVADDPNALPPGRKAAAAALPMQQLASASGAGDPLASVQADEVEVPADAPQSAAESVPPETPEEAVAAAETPGPAPLALDEPALASDPSLGRTDVAAASDIAPAGTVELDAADGPESLPADAPTEPATDTAEIDPSAATSAAAPALAETEPLAGLSPEDRPSIAAPTEPALQAPASDAPEVDPSTATSVRRRGHCRRGAFGRPVAGGSAHRRAGRARPSTARHRCGGGRSFDSNIGARRGHCRDGAPGRPVAGGSTEHRRADRAGPSSAGQRCGGGRSFDSDIGAPSRAWPTRSLWPVCRLRIGPLPRRSSPPFNRRPPMRRRLDLRSRHRPPTPAISETAPLASLSPKDEAAVAPPAEPALQATLSVPLCGAGNAGRDRRRKSGEPPSGRANAPRRCRAGRFDLRRDRRGSAGFGVRRASARGERAGAGWGRGSRERPAGRWRRAERSRGPRSVDAGRNESRCPRHGGKRSCAADFDGHNRCRDADGGDPGGRPSQPAVSAIEAQPAAEGRTQLAVLAPPEIEPLAFDPNEQIQALLLRLNCARLDARFDAESGEVSLSGRLSSQADQRALVEQISAIAGIRRVEASTLKVLGKPYCEILDLLNRPELAKSDELRHDVGKLGEANVPDIQRLPVGAPLNLSFHAPDFASYVYVVYLSSDGTVSHLLPAGFPGQEARASRAIRDRRSGRRRQPDHDRAASRPRHRACPGEARSRSSSSPASRASRYPTISGRSALRSIASARETLRPSSNTRITRSRSWPRRLHNARLVNSSVLASAEPSAMRAASARSTQARLQVP